MTSEDVVISMDGVELTPEQHELAGRLHRAWLAEREAREALRRAVAATGAALLAARKLTSEPVPWSVCCAQLGGIRRQAGNARLHEAQQRRLQTGDQVPEGVGTDVSAVVADADPASDDRSPAGAVLPEGGQQRLTEAAQRGAERAADRERRLSEAEGVPASQQRVTEVFADALKAGRQALEGAGPGVAIGLAVDLVEQAAAEYQPLWRVGGGPGA